MVTQIEPTKIIVDLALLYIPMNPLSNKLNMFPYFHYLIYLVLQCFIDIDTNPFQALPEFSFSAVPT